MHLERSFRGSDESSAFDWERPAQDLDIPHDVARALYRRALQSADDLRRAEAIYRRWLQDVVAARTPVSPPPAPGRQTRVEREARGRRPRPQDAAVGLGKWTRSLLETEVDDAAPGADEVHRAIAALSAGTVLPGPADEAAPAA
ncbi:MAG TPA: hypothetical protein VF516_19525, partial [Kofleriaceae bacterium]